MVEDYIEDYIEQKILKDNNSKEYLSPLRTRRKRFKAKEILDDDAVIKATIVATILSESDQLNLLATLVEQIGEMVGLNTTEYNTAKGNFTKIKAEIAKKDKG